MAKKGTERKPDRCNISIIVPTRFPIQATFVEERVKNAMEACVYEHGRNILRAISKF
jgi:hypothetical protein